MGKPSTYGAVGKTDLFQFDPDALVIITDPGHTDYDERAAEKAKAFATTQKAEWEAFVRSIVQFGIIDPVVVRKDGEQTILIDGRQRVMGAREANRRLREAGKDPITVPAVIRRGAADSPIVGIVANEHRFESPPCMKARAMVRLLNQGRPETEVAAAFRMSVELMRSNYLPLADLQPPVQEAVDSGTIKQIAALQIAKLPAQKQIEKLRAIESGEVKAPTAKEARAERHKENGTKPQEKRMMVRRTEADRFHEALSTHWKGKRTEDRPSPQELAVAKAVMGWVLKKSDDLITDYPWAKDVMLSLQQKGGAR